MNEPYADWSADELRSEIIALVASVEALESERDRLRAIVERAHDRIALDEHVLRTLATDDLVALVGVLRQDYAEAKAEVTIQTNAANAAAEAVGNMAEYVSKTVTERDQLAQVLANMAECAHDANLAEPMCACPCHAPEGAIAERDRLKAVVEALAQAEDQTIRDAVTLVLAAEDTVTPDELGNPDWYTEEHDERDRLLKAARMVVAGIEFANPGGVTEPIPINRLADLKAALDASPTAEDT